MPSVTPETRPTTPSQASNPQELSQLTSSSTNSLRNFAQIAALSMALTNSEPATAQSAIAPNPPAGHPAYVNVQRPDGTVIQVPVVSSIPQGYAAAQGAQPPTYQTQQPTIQQGNLPVYGSPVAPMQPVVQPVQGQPAAVTPGTVTYPGQVPMAPGAQGAAPQGELRVVSPGGAVPGTAPVAQPATTYQYQQDPTTLAPSSQIPTVAQAQLQFDAARMAANPSAHHDIDQARLNLQAARMAEQAQIRATREAERRDVQYQRELMRYNNDAKRYHNERAQYFGWFGDLVLPSKVPGPLVPPVPPRVPR